MNHAHDRRATSSARIPFDAMVEVGGALGPTFEAQAVNLSEHGMSLRTAYLPEVGQPVMCRFDASEGASVTAAGEVLWNQPTGDGGEFGIRFTNLDVASTVSLQRILGMIEDGRMVLDPGRKVRLHIEGLASPMRARIKAQETSSVTAYSDLGFLQVGRPLDLEDAASGTRRAALIDRVEIEMDEASRVPQLVVSLRYDDTDARSATVAPCEPEEVDAHEAAPPLHEHEAAPPPPEHEAAFDPDEGSPDVVDARPDEAPTDAERVSAMDFDEPNEVVSDASSAMTCASDEEEEEEAESRLKSAFARNAAKITPMLLDWAKRAKTTASILAARARQGRDGATVDTPVRRTTAPAPGGGLHTSGRRVVRGSTPNVPAPRLPTPLVATTEKVRLVLAKKKKVVAASAVGVAALLVFLMARGPDSPSAELVAAAPAVEATTETIPMPTAVITALPPAEIPTEAPAPAPEASAVAAAPKAKPARPMPFRSGNVGSRPNVIRIKMDGPVERILGASQPTGFTIVIPNRQMLDPADSVAEKDARIADVDALNEPTGAELNVSFKDGVPNYMVRARGETLEVLIARANSHGNKAPEAKAKPAANKKRASHAKDAKDAKSTKNAKAVKSTKTSKSTKAATSAKTAKKR